MILAAAATPSPADRTYVARLDAVHDSRAAVAQAPMATVQERASAMQQLQAGEGGIHAALAGAGELSPDLPSGATSFAHGAASLVGDAVKELERGQVGLSFDASLVAEDVTAAMGRIATAMDLVLYPPSGVVHDGG